MTGRAKTARWVIVGLGGLAALGCAMLPGSHSRLAAAAPAPHLAVWCEFLPYREVEEYLPILQRYNCRLFLHVEPADVGSPELERLLLEADRRGVEVWLWQLLPYEQNLYVGEDTLDRVEAFSLELANWIRRRQLPVDWLIFDCEPSPGLGRRLALHLKDLDLSGMIATLREETDQERFRRSVDRLNQLIARLHGRGFRTMGSANRIFLDFMRCGNPTLQDSLNAPFSQVHWDRVSFITYRYTASRAEYAAMVRRYAELGRRFFGPEAALDLGLTGDHRVIPEHLQRARQFGLGDYYIKFLSGMQDPRELEQAVGVALGSGLRNINIYSLDGAAQSRAGLEAWLAAASSARPVRGIRATAPVQSLKLGAAAIILDGLYRSLVI